MIVVDANVVASAGDKEQYPMSVNSRDILNHISSKNSLKIRMCETLAYEYKAHWSRKGKAWYTEMLRRGRVEFDVISTSAINRRIGRIASMSVDDKNEAKKDTHILLLGQKYGAIISIEIKAKNIYIQYSRLIPEISNVTWESPVSNLAGCREICDNL